MKLKKFIPLFISGGVMLLSLVLLICFPRQDFLVLATILAILFWLSLLITVLTAFRIWRLHKAKMKRKKRNEEIRKQVKTRDINYFGNEVTKG